MIFIKDKTKDEFFTSKILQDAVIRRLEIIGEAIKNLPMEFREKFKGKNLLERVLIHKYFGADLCLTWGVIKKEINTSLQQPQYRSQNILKSFYK
ncbi:HepT-like ribonuclease domain-containing protein [Methanocaldococcus infernus]|uniref:HepT-like ribonuclease domain-containing protein n=1 Tax=Methanocaldococcus infernus TaxID=67760 RepID=UPI0018DE07B8